MVRKNPSRRLRGQKGYRMRTEYTIRITDNKGKVSICVYPKKYADEKAADYRERLTDCKVEYFKVVYYGATFHHAERIF